MPKNAYFPDRTGDFLIHCTMERRRFCYLLVKQTIVDFRLFLQSSSSDDKSNAVGTSQTASFSNQTNGKRNSNSMNNLIEDEREITKKRYFLSFKY